MCFHSDDYAECYTESTVKTRKPHICEGCHKTFPAGSQMLHMTGIFDGAWFSVYACNACQMLRLSIAAEELRHDCPWHTAWCPWEELLEYLTDRFEPLPMLTGTPEEAMAEVNRLHMELLEEKRKALYGKREVML